MTSIEFSVWTETPTSAHYRHDWTPTPDSALGGIWLSGVGTGTDGEEYFGLRGFSDFVHGMTHLVSPVCGFRNLKPTLDAAPPHLFGEYATIDWMEPYSAASDDDSTTVTFDSGKVVRDGDGCHWTDAIGRWEWHGRTISDVFVVHVPVQPGVDQEAFYRHELLFGRGNVEGTIVEGYVHQDFAYGPPGTFYTDLAIARELYGLWVSWVHEFEDGEKGGGCFWQGRDGIEGFGPGYFLDGGKTTAYKDITSTLTRNENRRLTRIEADIGGKQLTFDLSMSGGPLHFFGRLAATSDNRPIKRSWVFVEFPDGMVNGAIIDMVGDKYRLARGR